MKKLMVALASLMLVFSAYAEQIVITVNCQDGKADTGYLQSKLRDGWKVISAVAVQDSNSLSMIGKPKQAYTASIVYILEKKEGKE